MDNIVGPVIELVNLISSPISKCCKFHSGVHEEMRILREKWQDLEARKADTESSIQGKQPKKEVERWLEKADKIKGEIQAIEGKFAKMKYFSRAHVGKLAFKKREDVEKLFEMGVFTGSLVVDSPVSHEEILPTPPTLRGETMKEKILACVLNDDDRKIGVYGMGGIGKSTVMKHIYNSLLNEKQKFERVIWVTVSKTFDVFKLQHFIASKLNLDLSKFEEKTWAVQLYAALKDKRHVLIFDDLWEAFPLEDIGLPEPTHENGCKLVLTTRLLDVCRRMDCKAFKMELLSNEEAQKLFVDKMGRDVFDTPELKAIAEEVLERCAQLPLAIITTAVSFKCLTYDYEWRTALRDLRTSVKKSNDIEDGVLKILEFSYKHLKNEELKQCLLHCALYPEGFEIDKQELIEHLIDDGIMERMKSRKEKFDKGYSMLQELEKACLLEGCISGMGRVKMHDLVREMALWIASRSFMVEAGVRMKDFPGEENWTEDLEKVCMAMNSFSEIPSQISPRCPKLSTLFLQHNPELESVPGSFFVHLHGLTVLDLSCSRIKNLPESVSNLRTLTTLRLRRCRNLKHMPSLAKLTKLRKLDLMKTAITEVPHGLEMLVNLRYLDLSASELQILPLGILGKLPHLQYLKVFLETESLIVEAKEVASLKKLEYFQGQFHDTYDLSRYVKSLEEGRLTNYIFHVGMQFHDDEVPMMEYEKRVKLFDCNISKSGAKETEESFMLPKDVEELHIERCQNLRSLSDVPSLNHTSKLKCISLCNCQKIKKLFTPGLQLHLHNLERIKISCCEQLEEIIATTFDDEEEKEEGMDNTVFTLPRLKYLYLHKLPELKTICGRSKQIVCDSIERIKLSECPKLERLPLALPLRNGQLSPPPSFQWIIAEKEWWEALEWDQHDTKNVLQPFYCKTFLGMFDEVQPSYPPSYYAYPSPYNVYHYTHVPHTDCSQCDGPNACTIA